MVSIFIDEHLYRMLREIATIYGMSVSEVIRTYILRGVRGEYNKFEAARTDVTILLKHGADRGDAVKCLAVMEEVLRITRRLSELAMEMKKCVEEMEGKH